MNINDKPTSRVEAILQRMLGSQTNIEKPASRVEFLLANVKDLLLAVEDEVERLAGKTTRILYTAKTNPTAQEIDAFAISKGYVSPYEGVAIVVDETYHVWHYYENDNLGWKDDGVDTVTPFTNNLPGSILGSAADGKISANQDGTGSVNGWDNIPVIKDSGRSTTKTKTINDPADVDSHGNPIDRTNTVNGAFSSIFGSRNNSSSGTTETFVSGGKNTVDNTEDSLVSGYQNTVINSHQSIIIGYDNEVEASESAIFGEKHVVFGESSAGRPVTRKLLLCGGNHSVGPGSQYSIISGENNTIGANLRHSIISGSYMIIGNNAEAVNIFGGGNGYSNELKNNIADVTIFGYSNVVYGGSSSSNRKGDNYIIGHHNTIQDPNNQNRGFYDVYMFGNGLKSRRAHQIIVGEYNAYSSIEDNDIFVVGTGSDNSHRKSSFGTGYDGTKHYIRVGSTFFYEDEIATKTYVNNLIGDINSVLDSINGQVI